MLNALTLTDALLDDLLCLRMSEADAVSLLRTLQPERMTVSDLAMLVAAMRRFGLTVPAVEQPVLDCCGTGGSGQPHFNTSTSVAFVLAAGGVPVVKFGNRAASSASGSFDFLEALGLPVTKLAALPEVVASCGLAFLYAPQCYPVLAPFNRLRRTLKQRTVFNFLGPLLNPVQPSLRLMGVSHAGMQDVLAGYLREYHPPRRAWLIYGNHGEPNGLDEINTNGVSRVVALDAAGQREMVLTYPSSSQVVSHDERASDFSPLENVRRFQAMVEGEDRQSDCYRMVCLNAAAGLVVAGQVDTLAEGERLAADLLSGGKVREQLAQCRRVYAELID